MPSSHRNMKKVQGWIPISTWEQLEQLGYTSPTVAILTAFDRLIESETSGSSEIPEGSPGIHVQDKLIIELKNHIETLKNELDKSERDKEDLKTTYNNYFLQVQTLINQKAITTQEETQQKEKKKWWKLW